MSVTTDKPKVLNQYSPKFELFSPQAPFVPTAVNPISTPLVAGLFCFPGPGCGGYWAGCLSGRASSKLSISSRTHATKESSYVAGNRNRSACRNQKNMPEVKYKPGTLETLWQGNPAMRAARRVQKPDPEENKPLFRRAPDENCQMTATLLP